MAQKRMFTMKIVDSDAFLDMPLSAQCLYFHLNMRADDDGFIGNPKRIIRTIGCNEDDFKILIMKRFVLSFEDGVIVIKHWRMHNCISQNRYHETQYTDEKGQLLLKDNKSYSFTHGEPLDDKRYVETKIDEPQVIVGPVDEVVEKEKRGKTYSTDFEDFWKEYPRKADKGQAYKKYQARIKSGYSPEELMIAARNYKLECVRKHTQMEYIKHAKTFLGDATPFVEYLKAENEPVEYTENVDFSNYL